jgi:hypothetical protein
LKKRTKKLLPIVGGLSLISVQFSDIVRLPHIGSETSSLVRQVDNPALAHIPSTFRAFIVRAAEIPAPALDGARREEFQGLGLTDAVILHVCGLTIDGIGPTLVTADTRLADKANSLGYSMIDDERDFRSS